MVKSKPAEIAENGKQMVKIWLTAPPAGAHQTTFDHLPAIFSHFYRFGLPHLPGFKVFVSIP